MSAPRRILAKVFAKNKKILGLILSLALLQSLLTIVIPFITKQQIEILEGKPAALQFTNPGVLFLLFTATIFVARALFTLMQGLEKLSDTLARERLTMEMDKNLYAKMGQLDEGFLTNPKNRRLIYILFEIGHLPWDTLSFARSSVALTLSMAGILPILALTSLRVLALVTGFGLLQFMVTRSRMRRENAFRLYKEKALAGTNELTFLLRYDFHRLLSVSGETRVMPRYFTQRQRMIELEMKEERITLFYGLLATLTENLTILLTGAMLGVAVLAGEISIGTFTMVTLYAATLQGALSGVNHNFAEYYRLKAIGAQLGFFLTMRSRVDMSNVRKDVTIPRGEISLEEITFSYPGLLKEEREYLALLVDKLKLAGKKREMWSTDWELVAEWERLLAEEQHPYPVLTDLTHSFPEKSITALVGKNGSGKTTLTRLLMRSYDPERGHITLGGLPMTQVAPGATRAHFSLVPQTPFLLESFSLRDNILLGCGARGADPTDDEITHLLSAMGFGSRLADMPHGLDTLLGDEVSLSGGESQMVGITRALLQDRPWLILDEGTNQLDAEHELIILNLLRARRDRTSTIIITHRMTTAKKADTIAVLDKGAIAQVGSHDALLEAGGLYRKFWEMQVLD